MYTFVKSTKSKEELNTLPYYIKYAECIRTLYKDVIALFEMASGVQSIRTDVEATQLGFSSIFLLNGFIHMLSLCGDGFMNFFSLDKNQFIDFTENLLFHTMSSGNYKNA